MIRVITGSEPASADSGIIKVHQIVELAPGARVEGAVHVEDQSSFGTSMYVEGLQVVDPELVIVQARSKPSPPTGWDAIPRG